MRSSGGWSGSSGEAARERCAGWGAVFNLLGEVGGVLRLIDYVKIMDYTKSI